MAAFVYVKLYGLIKEVIGKEQIEMEMPATGILEDLLQELIRLHPELEFESVEDMTTAYLILAESQVVNPSHKLTENDEIMIFPFVDGG